eukprot:UN27800
MTVSSCVESDLDTQIEDLKEVIANNLGITGVDVSIVFGDCSTTTIPIVGTQIHTQSFSFTISTSTDELQSSITDSVDDAGFMVNLAADFNNGDLAGWVPIGSPDFSDFEVDYDQVIHTAACVTEANSSDINNFKTLISETLSID